jgi:predicted deoxyguanosinetriphosphate triphosphohydrolase
VPRYGESATARWVAEPPKRAGRSDFERDRARVLHSAALRRLAAKTQVVAAGSADFPRTRLTHSLECAQIGRELGRELGCDPDLVDAACLAHDIGHSPFGHNGETALNELAAEAGGFEGNAQSLRLLTRLEPKVPGAGLNLTRASLDATLKYPWFSVYPGGRPPGTPPILGGNLSPQTPSAPQTSSAPPQGQGPGRKFGVYAEDAEVFGWIRQGAPIRRPCLEAQVMDWADDIAYSVHDLEDGFHAGLITFKNLNSLTERTVVSQTTATTYVGDDVSVAELTEVLDALLDLDVWPVSYDGSPESAAALKNVTSELIGRFCLAAQDATLAAHPRPLTRYAADLIVPRQQRLECALLKGITAHYVMTRAGVAAAQARERELLAELAFAVERGAPQTLDPLLRPAWHAAASEVARRRVVIDQIASLTDTSAIAWHHRLCVLSEVRVILSEGPARHNLGLMSTIVIVGASLAGAKAAETLRDEGFDGQIVLLGAEPELPYERPPLSKGYLLGNEPLDSVYVHPEDWYAEHGVDLRRGVTVTGIDRATSAVITLDETVVPYDKLLLTTGASPRRLNFPGSDRPEVLYLRTTADSERLRAAFQQGPRVVVAGAGWIGLETTAAARSYGCPVTVLEPQPGALHDQLGPELGAVFADLHRSHGVQFRFGERAEEFRPGLVITSAGAEVPADLFVVGIGAAPNDQLAATAGLEVSNGVLADEALRTTDPGIFAAGDVAHSYHPLLGRRVRVEHWANALNGGPAAARSMLGQPVVYDPVPYFYSDQYDLGMECAGLPSPGTYDEVAYRGDRAGLEFIAFWLAGGRVVAGMNVNVWDVNDDIQALIRSARPVDLSRLTDPDIPLPEV